jgi:uncharacterized repeat protein (TIGR01451 family)
MKLKTLAFIAASSAITLPAFAADYDITDTDTLFGTAIDNTATLSYTVPGATAATTTDSNDVSFKVDRKVIFALSNDHSGTDNETVDVGDEATTVYTLTNNSNAPIDYLLSLPDATTTYSFTLPGDTTPTVITNASSEADRTISLTVGDNATGGTDEIDITVASTVPASIANGGTFDTSLSVTAIERTATGTTLDPQLGTAGAPIVATDAATEWAAASIQTVAIAAWLNTDGDIERSDSQTFTVQTALISLTKEVRVIWDPITGDIDVANDVNPRAIPGAIVEYTLTVVNRGPAAASDITLTDTVVEQLAVTATGFIPVYKAAGTSINAGDTTDDAENVNLTIAGQLLTFDNISVTADQDTSDNSAAIESTDGTTVITFTVKLK